MAKEIKDLEEFEKFIKVNDLVVVHFMEEWEEECKQMNELMSELERKMKEIAFARIMAVQQEDISMQQSVACVPTFILYKNGLIHGRIEGADGATLTNKCEELAKKVQTFQGNTQKEDIETTLKRLINSHKLMLFMKGSPDSPRCEFCKTTIELLKKYNVDYGSFDILTNEEVRQGLKKFYHWPAYPQLYLNGELLGGLHTLKDMENSGKLERMLPKL